MHRSLFYLDLHVELKSRICSKDLNVLIDGVFLAIIFMSIVNVITAKEKSERILCGCLIAVCTLAGIFYNYLLYSYRS